MTPAPVPEPEQPPHLSAVPDLPADHTHHGPHRCIVGGDQATPEAHSSHAAHAGLGLRGPILRDDFLGLLADTANDIEATRIGLQNRYRQLTRTDVDKDGQHRGLGYTAADPEAGILRAVLIAIGPKKMKISDEETITGPKGGGVEHQAILKLNRRVRAHPLWKTWAKQQIGIGEKQFGRLLGVIGDPYWNDLHDRPRTVSELWAYCGYQVVHPAGHTGAEAHYPGAGGVAPRRQKGQRANWSQAARMRVWNISKSCILQADKSPYYPLYLATKAHYADTLHTAPCPRCTPEGKPPAPAGSPLTKAHIDARGVRAISKEILKDLWLAARDLHYETTPDPATDRTVTIPEAPGPGSE